VADEENGALLRERAQVVEGSVERCRCGRVLVLLEGFVDILLAEGEFVAKFCGEMADVFVAPGARIGQAGRKDATKRRYRSVPRGCVSE
jgi:hypothetical protein